MNNLRLRILLFLIGCIGVRVGLTIASMKVDKEILPYFGYAALAPALGFLIIFAFNLRKTGAEVFGEQIWWNKLRPIHGILYAIFAYLAIKQNEYSWIPLAIDVSLGLISFSKHHLSQTKNN